MKEKSLKSNILWNSIGSFVYLFCQWLLTFLIIRLSDNLADAGILSLAISITNIFFTVACFNLRPYLVSDNTNEFKPNEYASFRLFTIIISFITCFIYCLFFRYNCTQLICIMIFMVYKIGEAIVDLYHAFEQRKNRMDIGGISLLIRGIITIICFIVGLKIFNSMIISLLLMTIFTYLFIFTYDIHNVKKFESIKISFKNNKNKELLLLFSFLAIGSFLGTLSGSVPKQVLEKIMGVKELGIYATLATPAVIVQVAASYVYNPLLVSFSNFRKEKNYKKFKKLFLQTVLVITGLSVVCYIGSIFFAKPVLDILYGSKISKYYKLFNVIIIYTSLTGYLWFFHNILVIFRKLKEITIIYFTGFIICLLTSAYFINLAGMNGVSYTLILLTIVMIIEMLIVIYKNIKLLKK